MSPAILLIREQFLYDDGRVIYKKAPKSRPSLVGKEAGSVLNTGYRQISLKKKRYTASHVVWVLFNDEFPKDQIDHINRNPLDNRIENLRQSTRLENSHNRNLINTSSTGYTGVTWDKADKIYRVKIVLDGRATSLGRFKDIHDAAEAYNRAASKHFGVFANLNVIERAGINLEGGASDATNF